MSERFTATEVEQQVTQRQHTLLWNAINDALYIHFGAEYIVGGLGKVTDDVYRAVKKALSETT